MTSVPECTTPVRAISASMRAPSVPPTAQLSAVADLGDRLERHELDAPGQERLAPASEGESGTSRALNTSVSTTTAPRRAGGEGAPEVVGESPLAHRPDLQPTG